ncbi:MAG: ADP-glyceromanno-heptose 6-epimerase [Gemmataceae bacterium]|nr:ADP-glyceromanno-heptose 6-epimerase [Gemmataceae bacterium]
MIAVTGAGGFIGSTLAHRLSAAGQELLLVDRSLNAGKAANLAGLPRFQYIGHDDFLDELALGRLKPEAVFHLGACSRTTETNWGFLKSNNIQYSQKLWTWCAAAGVPFIYASSAATYGDGSRGFDDRTLPGDLHPLNLYGRSKNDFDAWVLSEVAGGRHTPPRWAGLKFFNVYGPRETHKGRMASVVWQTFCQIRQTGGMRLFASTDPRIPDGGQQRDFVHVEDCIDHMLWLWKNSPGGIFNSGTGQARSFFDLASAVFAAMCRKPRIEFIPTPADIAGQYQNFTQADLSKLRATGFPGKATPLEDGIDRTVAAYELRAAA